MAPRREPTAFIDSFVAVKKCLTALAGQTYAKAEIGSTQANFLRYIGARKGISQAELARATGTDPTLTGRALHSLIQRGLVCRERSDQDRREYILQLGPAGRRAQKRVEKLRAELASRVVSVLDAKDLDDFERVAGKIVSAFDLGDEQR